MIELPRGFTREDVYLFESLGILALQVSGDKTLDSGAGVPRRNESYGGSRKPTRATIESENGTFQTAASTPSRSHRVS